MRTGIRIGFGLCAALLCWATAAAPALADRRVALIIGNSAYLNASPLENPRNDAADLAKALRQFDFEVTEGRDLDKASMDRTIRDFALKLAGARMALFFYAGHGIQVGGQNYLVPIDAQLATGAALDFEMVRLDLIQRTMEREVNTNIIILDACRDNPLARNLGRALGTRSTSIGRGLAAMESGEGTLISFSTQPGNVALDGTGRNSPFVTSLLKRIAVPGEDLPTILINVRNDVIAATERRQVPWEHSALTSKVFFVPPKLAMPSPNPQADRDLQVELTFWSSVKDSTDPAVLGTYLKRYPNGEFASIAQALIEHYERQANVALASREEAKKREREALAAAQVKRIEEEQRQVAAAAERKAKDANNPEARKLEEQQRAEIAARMQDLQKAVEEARRAREDAKQAETQRLAAVKAAQEATKAAENAIAKKRDTEKTSDPAKLAALPKLEVPRSLGGGFDGTWTVTWVTGPGCMRPGSNTYHLPVANGAMGGKAMSGRVSANGAARWVMPSINDGAPVRFEGTFRGATGSGSFSRQDGKCSGTFTARKG